MGNYLCCGPRKHLRTDVSTDPDTRTLGPRVTIKMKKPAKSKHNGEIRKITNRKKMAELSARVDALLEENNELLDTQQAQENEITYLHAKIVNSDQQTNNAFRTYYTAATKLPY